MSPAELERQLRLVMHQLAELAPGSVCLNVACPEADRCGAPHMANDCGPHPEPYGLRSSKTYEWRPRSGLDRVADAVRRARGGEAPSQPQGFA